VDYNAVPAAYCKGLFDGHVIGLFDGHGIAFTGVDGAAQHCYVRLKLHFFLSFLLYIGFCLFLPLQFAYL